jgi:AAT family amino acid transporter
MDVCFDPQPFNRCLAGKDHPLPKGNVLSAGSYVLLSVLTKGSFELLLGNFGLAYFNPKQLMKRPWMAKCSAFEDASRMPL